MKNPILFYDDICKTCIFSIRFLIRIDKKQKLRFSPINSSTFRQTVNINQQDILPDSVILINNGIIFTKSEAVLEIFSILGGFWKLCLIFRLLPRCFRDKGYDLVAKNRYRLFGKRESCFIPNQNEKQLFLP
ncbi:MAG: DUF393 domain-containing protein [Bacteroidetes bacterium]|nr:DUF393 domain-containing protein [Bacteroidota bacterium]